MSEEKCRICGCTDNRACVDPNRDPPNCHWVDKELCSFCAEKHNLRGQLNDNEKILVGNRIYKLVWHFGKEPKLRRIWRVQQ